MPNFTHTLVCENHNFDKAQDVTSISVGGILVDEQGEDRVRNKVEPFSGEGLTDNYWSHNRLIGKPIGKLPTAKAACIF